MQQGKKIVLGISGANCQMANMGGLSSMDKLPGMGQLPERGVAMGKFKLWLSSSTLWVRGTLPDLLNGSRKQRIPGKGHAWLISIGCSTTKQMKKMIKKVQERRYKK
ncbi:MAG: hypothetical protein CM15mP120_21430 [Pseudomonadota bacterium]|nr:MAG: hypothetical protein CM15mP120_21430 [Pseudomonadota bacterium]